MLVLLGAGDSHLKLKISKGTVDFEVVAFGQGSKATEFSQVKQLELAVTLSVNQWNGQTPSVDDGRRSV